MAAGSHHYVVVASSRHFIGVKVGAIGLAPKPLDWTQRESYQAVASDSFCYHWDFISSKGFFVALMKWLQLVRAPNAPTAAANILAAFLLANHNWSHWPELVLLIVSSVALYCSGMVLNDVFDIEADKLSQPNRPLPSGQIAPQTARRLGWGLMIFGVVVAIAAGVCSGSPAALLRCGIVATVLAGAIYLYDGPLKRTLFAPALMGACRSLNFLLGATTFRATAAMAGGGEATIAQTTNTWLGFPSEVIWVAVAIGILITGVTLLARNETHPQQNRGKLAIASLVIFLGFALLAALPWCPGGRLPADAQRTFPLLILLVSAIPIRRLIICLAVATPGSVKSAIISNLRSLIILDASICFLVRPDNFVFALAVLALLIPVFILSNWLYST